MSRAQCQACLNRVEAVLAAHGGSSGGAETASRSLLPPAYTLTIEERARCELLRARLLDCVGRRREAEAAWRALHGRRREVEGGCDNKGDYVVPFSLYDAGAAALARARAVNAVVSSNGAVCCGASCSRSSTVARVDGQSDGCATSQQRCRR